MPDGKRPAIFLDRDGVLIELLDYLNQIDQVVLTPGVGPAISKVNHADIPLVVVTNQSGIARGLLTEHTLSTIHKRIEQLLADDDARLDAIYYCPHHPEIGASPYRQQCLCRKPSPGMLLQAAQDLNIDLSHSILIGDHVTDIEAGMRAGVASTILVLTGYGQASAKALATATFSPSVVSANAAAALDLARNIILKHAEA